MIMLKGLKDTGHFPGLISQAKMVQILEGEPDIPVGQLVDWFADVLPDMKVEYRDHCIEVKTWKQSNERNNVHINKCTSSSKGSTPLKEEKDEIIASRSSKTLTTSTLRPSSRKNCWWSE